ncbi:hypothetical protein V1527DRAFT_330416 [Lipomyces starkeyi]
MVYTSHGLTTRLILMIAVDVGVSQSHDSVRAAISRSVCALRCRLGLAMSISEGSRGETPRMRYYASVEKAKAAVGEAEEHFNHQLTQRPYGPLVRYGVRPAHRVQSHHCTPATVTVRPNECIQ